MKPKISNYLIKILFSLIILLTSMACNKNDSAANDLPNCTSYGDSPTIHCDFGIDKVDGTTHKVGRSVFNIVVTPVHEGVDPSGLNLTITPLMNMGTNIHSTPVQSITDMGIGYYQCIVYYLMPTATSGSGDWSIKVNVDNQTVKEYPIIVSGSMMDKATLNAPTGSTDLILVDGSAAKRSYNIFMENYTVANMNLDSIQVYVSAKEEAMIYPALHSGVILHDETGAARPAVTSISMAVSNDPTDSASWKPLTAVSSSLGSYKSENGLAYTPVSSMGSMSSSSVKLYFKLTVDTEAKMSGTYDYASLTTSVQ